MSKPKKWMAEIVTGVQRQNTRGYWTAFLAMPGSSVAMACIENIRGERRAKDAAKELEALAEKYWSREVKT